MERLAGSFEALELSICQLFKAGTWGDWLGVLKLRSFQLVKVNSLSSSELSLSESWLQACMLLVTT
jgi:hypothetical protein